MPIGLVCLVLVYALPDSSAGDGMYLENYRADANADLREKIGVWLANFVDRTRHEYGDFIAGAFWTAMILGFQLVTLMRLDSFPWFFCLMIFLATAVFLAKIWFFAIAAIVAARWFSE